MAQRFTDTHFHGDGFDLVVLEGRHVDDMVVGCRDEETQRWLPLPQPYTPEAARSFVDRVAPTMQADGTGLVRGIEVGGRLAGVIDLKKTDWRSSVTEIGYWVGPWARGGGLAGRATRLLADWALVEQGMARVVVRAAAGNLASQRAAVSAGFTPEGVARSAGIVHGGRVDLAVFAKVVADL